MYSLTRMNMKSSIPTIESRFVVIGGGIVGLAVSSVLSTMGTTTLLERHKALLQETSSRNSGVVHAGIYYPADSLKTSLCLKGNANIWRLSERYPDVVKGRRCGKWIGACDDKEIMVLEKLADNMKSRGIPYRWVPNEEVSKEEPNVRMISVLESPNSGIVDVHSLADFFLKMIRDAPHESYTSTATEVTGLERGTDNKGWLVNCLQDSEEFRVVADTVVTCMGNSTNDLWKRLLGGDNKGIPRGCETFHCKGRYVGYRCSPHNIPVKRLVYPCPLPELKGLGVHSVIDLDGNLRFGPDAHYLDTGDDVCMGSEKEQQKLVDEFYSVVMRYIPSIEKSKMFADFCGTRPKLSRAGESAKDFKIHSFNEYKTADGKPGLLALCGIESPGLTACTALGNYVGDYFVCEPSVNKCPWKE